MSQAPSQTQTQKSFFEAPIFTREELEKKLRELSEDLRELREALENLRGAFADVLNFIYYKTIVSTETFVKISEKFDELKQAILDAIDETVVNELGLDVDVDKYEKQYNVKFTYETERLLGVALLKDNESVKPAVIWTDYDEVWYYEGERSE